MPIEVSEAELHTTSPLFNKPNLMSMLYSPSAIGQVITDDTEEKCKKWVKECLRDTKSRNE